MQLAMEHGLSSIAFPAISTGIYGYPKDEACEVAVDTVIDFCKSKGFIIDVYYVLFDNENFTLYTNYIIHLKSKLK